MFEQAFVRSNQAAVDRCGIVCGAMLFVGVMALVPLAQTGVINPARLTKILIAQPPGPPPRALESHPHAGCLTREDAGSGSHHDCTARACRVPDRVLIEDGSAAGINFRICGPGLPGGIPVSDGPQLAMPAPAPHAPVTPPAAPEVRVRRGGDVQAGRSAAGNAGVSRHREAGAHLRPG